jgi:gliding motility-associated-like protein
LKKILFFILLFFSAYTDVVAKHIVGGEIIYDYLGGGNYRVTLKLYRDCFGGGPAFDGTGAPLPPAILTVFSYNGDTASTYDLGTPIVTNIPPSINNPCIIPPGGVCVEEGIYTTTLNLPPVAGGYFLVYQRCCRNNTILNLVTPGNQGVTYYTKIPGPEETPINSSPRFKHFPPIFLCNNLPFTFDHSATDPDGDQLVYSLCPPFQGLDPTCPTLSGGACPSQATPMPYQNVLYANPYSGNYPIASNPAFTIHPITGELTGRPNLLGQFVVGVCIKEYRGNQLINVHYRDFQFNVTSCIINVASVFADQVQKCEGTTIQFINQSFGNIGPLTYLWDFGVPGIDTDTSSAVNPNYTYPDTGQYVVTLIANPNKPCSDTLRKTFFVYPVLNVKFDAPDKQCLKGNSFNFNNSSVHLNSATFNWDFSPTAIPATSTLKNPTGIYFTQAGKFFVKLVVKQYSCIDSFIDSVRVVGRPIAKINSPPTSGCDPFKLKMSNGSSSPLPLTYTWLFSNGNSSPEYEPLQVLSPPGVYGATLIAKTSGLCVDTSIASVQHFTVYPTPDANFVLSPSVTTILDPEIQIRNLASDDVTQWHYYLGDGSSSSSPNLLYPYNFTGTYTVIQVVNNPFNCSDTAQKEVQILPEHRFWIPNTFTPNGDNNNDIFRPKGLGWLKYEFDIYNRWGEHIFSTNDPKTGWDGRFRGKNCQQDVYVWKIGYTNETTMKREDRVGHVLLLDTEN